MSATDRYAAMVDAYNEQRRRLEPPDADRWGSMAAGFRLDPRRELEANTRALLDLIEPGDVVVDVGGGAGRIGLPVALRCKEVINVEPSAGMRDQFDASAKEAGIATARCVAGGWPEAAVGVVGDVVMLANVTYFVREIVPFVEALQQAARRRVVIAVWSVPPPNHSAALYPLLHGEPQALVPSYQELLPVLWEMGILPDVHVLNDRFRRAGERPPTREDAVKFALQRVGAEHVPGAAAAVEAHLEELFTETPDGFAPNWVPPTREMLITWTTAT